MRGAESVCLFWLRSDLKGANVLLKSAPGDVRGYTCKLADFGLSRVLGDDTTHASINTHGACCCRMSRKHDLCHSAAVLCRGTRCWSSTLNRSGDLAAGRAP